MIKIALVGCGNIGSRHLQAIVKLSHEIQIEVVEPNVDAQKIAKIRLKEISYDKSIHNILWYHSISDLKNESDLAIIATSSIKRAELINNLLKKGHSRFLIEKIVCQSVNEYENLLENFKNFGAKGWINTPRRYFSSYQKIKQFFDNLSPIHLSVIAGNLGLGCNAIHFIDFFSWIVNDCKPKVNGELLLNQLLPNKRGDNLLEFAGTLTGSTAANSTFNITFLPLDNIPTSIVIAGQGKALLIDETQKKIHSLEGDFASSEFNFDYVSNTTTMILNDILQNDTCELPTLEESSYAHFELFRIFRNHIKKLTNKEPSLCPIT